MKIVKYDDIVIGQYADYSAHVWDNEGKHYDLLSASGRLAALRCSDSFVRNMALEYVSKNIKTELKTKPRKQAIAIALSVAGKSKKKK